MKEPSKLIDVPSTERYAEALREVEESIVDSPYELLLRALHSSASYLTTYELASVVFPDGGPTAHDKVMSRLTSLGRLLRRAIPERSQWAIYPRTSEFGSNSQAYWSTLTSCFKDGDRFKFRLLPEVGKALETLGWVEQKAELPPTDMEALRAEREKRLQAVWPRRGQKEFRIALLDAYRSRCAVTGCNAVDALEAAHISPYCESQSCEVTNGLLLRADIHTLFDLDLVGIDPTNRAIALAPCLLSTSYKELHGKQLAVPAEAVARPSQEHLAKRWLSFRDRCG